MSTDGTTLDGAADWFRGLQDTLTDAFEALDGKARFIEDPWTRSGGGGGRTRVMTGGAVFEKVGVNFADVYGELAPDVGQELPGDKTTFRASGVSVVVHPLSPKVPAFHANVRRFIKGDTQWVAGGMDLTPIYARQEDAIHFHGTLQAACQAHDPAWYPRFKQWCDEYFYLPHRQEARGLGGIFFDYLGVAKRDLPARVQAQCPRAAEETVPIERAWLFCQEVGLAITKAYVPIVESRRAEPYTEKERQFQLYRRGRYVEFNLLHDRGTRFGLQTGGRTESILMSLPPLVRWTYDFVPEPGSKEAQLMELLKPRDWV